jgi:hypothetical protein
MAGDRNQRARHAVRPVTVDRGGPLTVATGRSGRSMPETSDIPVLRQLKCRGLPLAVAGRQLDPDVSQPSL